MPGALRSCGPAGLTDRRGHSLIELMVGIAVVGLILVGLSLILRETQLNYSQGSAAADVQGDVRAALDQITHDLRRAGRNARGTCVFSALPSGNATSVQIQRDLDNAGTAPSSCITTTAGSEEQIRFTFNSGAQTLTRQAGSGTASILARNATAPSGTIFTYWHLPMAGTICNAGALQSTSAPSSAQLTCTRRITVSLTGTIQSPAGAVTRTVRTDVDLRSR